MQSFRPALQRTSSFRDGISQSIITFRDTRTVSSRERLIAQALEESKIVVSTSVFKGTQENYRNMVRFTNGKSVEACDSAFCRWLSDFSYRTTEMARIAHFANVGHGGRERCSDVVV